MHPLQLVLVITCALALLLGGAEAFSSAPGVGVCETTGSTGAAGACVAPDTALKAAAGDGAADAAPSEPPRPESEAEALKLLSWLRVKTDGNGMAWDASTTDTPENRALWAEHAPKILELLPSDASSSTDGTIAQAYTEAVMYKVSSKGIISGIVSGNAFAFLNAVDYLAKNFPKQDNGVAFIFQGAYHLASPWPARSPKKAAASFEKALEVAPTSPRNLYYAGIAALALGDKTKAKKHFESVADKEPLSGPETDIASFVKAQAAKGAAST